MKIRSNGKLHDLAVEASFYFGISEVLRDHNIPCIDQCLRELYDGDARKMFKFGHENWGKQVISFWDERSEYFAIGSAKEIEKILKQELKEIEKEEESKDEE